MKQVLGLTFSFAYLCCCASSARGQTLEWTRQLGTGERENNTGVSADGLGNVYISGSTEGSLGGPNAGGNDAFISKYDASGAIQWTRQLGTSAYDSSVGVSADSLGNVYISGATDGSLGGPNAGARDAFLAKYDAGGTLQWTRQLGTGERDQGSGVSVDGLGNVYISATTRAASQGGPRANFDALLSKYDASGTLHWTRQLGTSDYDISSGVSADGQGNVYISGETFGSLAGTNAGKQDAFLAKYDSSGGLEWTRQLGTSERDRSYDVSADGLGNVYISGDTYGSLAGTNAGDGDAFLTKYDSSGGLEWTRQLGTSESDGGGGVSADGLGNIYISGGTRGSLEGTNAGSTDAFLTKYDASGTLHWTRQLGTSESDCCCSVSADGLGNIYSSGTTRGSLGGTNAGDWDAFVAKFSDGLPGDFDLDGDVDGNDFLALQRDGLTSSALSDWEANFGGTSGGGQPPVDPSPTDIRTWAIEATVTSLADPENVFTDVQLGARVTGFLSYDLLTPPDELDANFGFYSHAPTFEVAGMVVETSQGDVEFVARELAPDVVITNDDDSIPIFGEVDSLIAAQSIVTPEGLGHADPVIAVILNTPEAIPDASLPATLNLEDWALAEISFIDLFGQTRIVAEIFSLTPILTADLDLDSDVDGADFLALQRNGMTLANLASWQTQFGSAATAAAGQSVPEPATLILFLLAVCGLSAKRFSLTAKNSFSGSVR